MTGAAQGLGLGIAERLAHNGATVIMADLQRGKVAAYNAGKEGVISLTQPWP